MKAKNSTCSVNKITQEPAIKKTKLKILYTKLLQKITKVAK